MIDFRFGNDVASSAAYFPSPAFASNPSFGRPIRLSRRRGQAQVVLKLDGQNQDEALKRDSNQTSKHAPALPRPYPNNCPARALGCVDNSHVPPQTPISRPTADIRTLTPPPVTHIFPASSSYIMKDGNRQVNFSAVTPGV